MGLVRSFQISAVFPHLSVLDNVRVALQRPAGLATQFWRSSSAVLDALDERALRTDRGRQPRRPTRDLTAGDLSYGRKRVLEIATTLALDPEMLLLDEPMAGMGHEDIGRISDLIRAVAAEPHGADGRAQSVTSSPTSATSSPSCSAARSWPRATMTQCRADPRVREAYMGTEEPE